MPVTDGALLGFFSRLGGAPPAAERRTAGAEGARIPGDGTSWGLALHTTEITSAPPRKEQQLPYFFEEIPDWC